MQKTLLRKKKKKKKKKKNDSSLLRAWTCTWTESSSGGGDDDTHATITQTHDRTKRLPIPPHAPFLRALGVKDPNGRPRPRKTSKLRQCQKCVEIVVGLAEQHYGLAKEKDDTTPPQQRRPITVVDMGRGRGYLTF